MNRIRKAIACIICAILLIIALSPAVLAAEPTYNVSSKYKESKFYDNLLSVPLSGDQATDVLAVALSQLGYHEGDSDSDFGGENLSGTKNFVEYNRIYGKLDNGEGNGLSYGYYWCASFVNWCMQQAGVAKSQVAAREVSCYRWVTALTNAGMYEKAHMDYVPKSGDMIFFADADMPSWQLSTHVGLVRYVDGDTVYTIEGNTSNDSKFSSNGNYVCLKSYSLSDSFIVGYGLPDYKTDGSVPDVDYSDKELCAGLCISEAEIDVYSSAEDGEKLGVIKQFCTFEITEVHDGWAKIKFTSDGATLEGLATLSGKAHQMTVNKTNITVKYVAEGALNVPANETFAPDSDVVLSSKVPQKKDARFIGWSLTEGAKRSDYEPGERILVSGDVTLYAVWDEDLYTVTFKDSDGSIISEVKGFSGDRLTPPEMSDRDGLIFEGWDGELPDTITESATFTAVYSEAPEQPSQTEDTTGEDPTEELSEQESEPDTEESTEEGSSTEAQSDPNNTDIPSTSGGCNSATLSSALALVIPTLGILAANKKKKQTR